MAQVTTNDRLVESRTKIGRYASLGGLAIIFAGLIASLQNNYLLAYGALIAGFILSNVGAYFLNRYGMKAHEKIVAALKGLDKRYRLYNFVLPVQHVLLTPYAVTVFLVKNQDGAIIGDEKGWRQGSNLLRIVRAFSSEPLGNPPKDLELQKEQMKQYLSKELGNLAEVPIDGYILFTNPNAKVTATNVDAPIVVLNQKPDALKNSLRRDKRTPQMASQDYDSVAELFDRVAEQKATEAPSSFQFWRR